MMDLQGKRDNAALSFAAVTAASRVEQLQPNPRRPQRECAKTDLATPAESLRQRGLLTSLHVRTLDDDCFELIAGERRWRAPQLMKLPTLPCCVIEVDEDQAFMLCLDGLRCARGSARPYAAGGTCPARSALR